MTAYTPGETLGLLQQPLIAQWHGQMQQETIDADNIVFVPCAKTKPWVGPGISRSRLYSAYNALRPQMPNTAFVTVSEPLGVVPMQYWADFPQYDNPGLFRDDSQRSGMTTKEWHASPFQTCYGLPFDKAAYTQSIQQLGTTIAGFMKHNKDKQFISLIDNLDGSKSTHGDMMDVATEQTGLTVHRHPKRNQPRADPLPYFRELLLDTYRLGK